MLRLSSEGREVLVFMAALMFLMLLFGAGLVGLAWLSYQLIP